MLVTGAEGVLVQGMTGRQGRFWTARMAACGTRIVAGATPGKGGQTVDGIPVYDSAREAAGRHQPEVSVLFVPPLEFAGAVLDALSAGIRKIVALTEHIPYQDVIEVLAEARDRGAQVLGPNTAGLVVPGTASVGIMPAFATSIFRPGTVGVISRSGSLGTLVCWQLVRAGYGQSAFIGVGGDPILGTTILDAVCELDQHPATSAIVVVGEIGGTMEERAASYIATMTKPVVAFIAGRSAPAGRRMGHAGAIISGHIGSGDAKVAALRDSGATVIDIPSQLARALRDHGLAPPGPVPRRSVLQAAGDLSGSCDEQLPGSPGRRESSRPGPAHPGVEQHDSAMRQFTRRRAIRPGCAQREQTLQSASDESSPRLQARPLSPSCSPVQEWPRLTAWSTEPQSWPYWPLFFWGPRRKKQALEKISR